MKNKDIVICVDFDGTIVKHEFPEIGEPVPNALECLREYQKRGYKIVLNTMRSDNRPVHSAGDFYSKIRNTLSEAVDYLEENGIKLYGVNKNPDQASWTSSPKVYGNLYIDDAAVGCPLLPPSKPGDRPYCDWVEINRLVEKYIKSI